MQFFLLSSCNKEVKESDFQTFHIITNLIPDSASKKMNGYHKNNTIVQMQTSNILSNFENNYHCEAIFGENDTLNIWLNNFNGYYGNGNLIKVFDDKFLIKSIDPNVLKGIKFEKYHSMKEILVLNKGKYKRGDSIFGYVYLKCEVDSFKTKQMHGFFKTKIKLQTKKN